jgi:hypothetical protein
MASGTGAWTLAVAENRAYLPARSGWMEIVDVSDPTSPVEVCAFAGVGGAIDAQVVGRYAYLAQLGGGLEVYDISNPAYPVERGSFAIARSFGGFGVDVVEGRIYLAATQGGLWILRFRDPTAANDTWRQYP